MWRARRVGAVLVALSRSAGATQHQRSWVSLRAGEAEREDEKTIYFVRHAVARHNKDELELSRWHADKLYLLDKYRDADLTAVGEAQCRTLAARVAAGEWGLPPDLVVVSPLTRALKTATLAFQGPFVATELARERIALHKCDQRSLKSALASKFPKVDFSEVATEDDVLWDRKEDEPDEMNATRCYERARAFLDWLARRPERRIAVVTHWVFLKHLLTAQFPDDPDQSSVFGNAEIRAVTLRRESSSCAAASD